MISTVLSHGTPASLPRQSTPKDPHELASWVNEIDGYRDANISNDPRELASWVKQIDSLPRREHLQRPPRAYLVGERGI